MGKPKRASAQTTAAARAASNGAAAAAAAAWWSSAVNKDPAPEPPASSNQDQNDWPPEDGEWFFIELIRELPLIIGVMARLILRLNKEYWLHVWVTAVGWRIGWHVVDIGEDLFPYSALLFTLMMYGFHELFLRMLW